MEVKHYFYFQTCNSDLGCSDVYSVPVASLTAEISVVFFGGSRDGESASSGWFVEYLVVRIMPQNLSRLVPCDFRFGGAAYSALQPERIG